MILQPRQQECRQWSESRHSCSESCVVCTRGHDDCIEEVTSRVQNWTSDISRQVVSHVLVEECLE